MKENEKKSQPPEISPYLFPAILAMLGLWCAYDGWMTSNPDMQEHQTFNRVAGIFLLLWSVIDFIRTRRIEKAYQIKKSIEESTTKDDI